MPLNIWNNSAIIKFKDTTQKEEPTVSVWKGWTPMPYNGTYYIKELTLSRTQWEVLNVSYNNYWCKYNYNIKLNTNFNFSQFTIVHNLTQTKGCELKIERIDGQSDADYQQYSSQYMNLIELKGVTLTNPPIKELQIGDTPYVMYFTGFLSFFVVGTLLFIKSFYKKGKFNDR